MEIENRTQERHQALISAFALFVVPTPIALFRGHRAIARTELAFAYNGGRIQSFRENGIESVRRYCITDERTCPVCLGLHNTAARLDDWLAMLRINAPSHPNCRCVLSPVIEDLGLPPPPETERQQWLVERILKEILS